MLEEGGYSEGDSRAAHPSDRPRLLPDALRELKHHPLQILYLSVVFQKEVSGGRASSVPLGYVHGSVSNTIFVFECIEREMAKEI